MQKLLNDYLNKWALTAPKQLAETPTSFIYKVQLNQTTHILKLYKDLGRIYEVLGPPYLNICHGNGVVNIIQYDDGAALLEYIDGPELLSLVDDGKDNEATEIIANTLNKIHSIKKPNDFSCDTLENRLSALFKYNDNETPDIVKRGAAYAKKRLTKQTEIQLLHGDMHHKNIMLHKNRGWIALDPNCMMGDRAYDCANTLHNPKDRTDLTEDKDRLFKQVDILGKIMNIDPQRILDYAYIHGCVSSCWTKMDEGYYGEDVLKTSAILEPYISES